MGIREDLLREEDITGSEVDLLLLSAQKHFEKEEQGQGKKSLIVDPEDIPLRFIDQALEELIEERKEREQAARDEEEKRLQEEQARRRKRIFLGLGTLLVVVGGSLGTAYVGRGPIDQSYIKVRTTQELAKAELERHELLEERFRTIAGDAHFSLTEMETTESNTKGVLNQVQAAIVHEIAMSQALRELPEAQNNTLSVKRLDLQADMLASTKSLQEGKSDLGKAEAEWRSQTETFSGWLAVILGIAPGPGQP